jgi:hypothetical protein
VIDRSFVDWTGRWWNSTSLEERHELEDSLENFATIKRRTSLVHTNWRCYYFVFMASNTLPAMLDLTVEELDNGCVGIVLFGVVDDELVALGRMLSFSIFVDVMSHSDPFCLARAEAALPNPLPVGEVLKLEFCSDYDLCRLCDFIYFRALRRLGVVVMLKVHSRNGYIKHVFSSRMRPAVIACNQLMCFIAPQQ